LNYRIREEVIMKKIFIFSFISILGLSFCLSFPLFAQEKKEADEVYTIKRGDTLWDISSRFLKNPFLWPKVWQRNPYITNPHWIYPGNTVRLNPLEEPKREEARREEPKREETGKVAMDEKRVEAAKEPEVKKVEPPQELKKPEVVAAGVAEKRVTADKPVFPEVRFAGFFSDIDFRGVGYVLDSREGKTALAGGDICYVGFRTKDPVSIGDKFTTFAISDDPIWMGTKFGRRYNITGIIQIIDQYGAYYTAKIIESFQEVFKGDRLMPYNKEKMEVGISNK
jgi:hypothetical protein